MTITARSIPAWTLLITLSLAAGAATYAFRSGRGLPTLAGADSSTTMPYATEEQWIVAETLRVMGSLTLYGSTGQGTMPEVLLRPEPSAAAAYRAAFRSPELPSDLLVAIVDHLWAPSTYRDAARRLAPKLPPAQANAEDDSVLLDRTTDARVHTLVTESARLSRQLRGGLGSPSAHERAAMLLAAFALGASAGDFSDLRPVLCRMAAHLALAEALRGSAEAGRAGRYASAALSVLTGRQVEALSRLEALPAEHPWTRALRVRATSDWRVLSTVPEATRLERREYFRALARCFTPGRARASVRGSDELSPDWGRLAMNPPDGYTDGPSVGDGHHYVPGALAREAAQVAEVRRARGESSLSLDDPASAALLNERHRGPILTRGGVVEVEILDWGLWAVFLQTHLCSMAERGFDFYCRSYGSPEVAREFRANLPAVLPRLQLYPIVRKRMAVTDKDRNEYRAAMKDATALSRRAPELITAVNWLDLRLDAGFAAPPDVPAPGRHWFVTELPRGTALEWDWRPWMVRLRTTPEVWDAAMRLAPYDSGLVRCALAHRSPPPDAATVRRELGPLVDYDAYALLFWAESFAPDDDAAYPAYRRLCELEVESCDALGKWLAGRGRDDEAAVAFQKWADECPNRVAVSNGVDWLVDYYARRKRSKEAYALARAAAEIGSFGGLSTLGRLLERDLDLRGAEEQYEAIRDRYDTPAMLLGFYERQLAAGQSRYREPLDVALRNLFPRGIEQVTRESFAGPPVDGVVITGGSARLMKAGLLVQDIVVALDGIRVHNVEQYAYVRDRTFDPQMALVFWRGSAYSEVRPKVEGRRFRVDISTYVPHSVLPTAPPPPSR